MNIHEGKEREKIQNFRTLTILVDVIIPYSGVLTPLSNFHCRNVL